MARKLKKTVKLSDGSELKIFNYTGRDMINANRIGGGDTLSMSFALIASRIEIDGKSQTMEDIEDMDGDLLAEIMEHIEGGKDKNFTSQPGT